MEDNTNSDGDCQQTGTIYKIINLVNGKIYVGQTKQQLEKRMNQHKHNSKTDKSGLAAAIRKYGWENFKVEVLEICPIDKLDEREIFWIAELNSKAPAGYNLTDGGEGTSNPSAKTRARMSANHPDVSGEKNPNYGKHRKHSQATRDKISAALKGANSPNYGKKFSKETCDKISANHADVSGEKNPNYGKHRKHSQATRDKMSASQKTAWARRKALAKGGDS